MELISQCWNRCWCMQTCCIVCPQLAHTCCVIQLNMSEFFLICTIQTTITYCYFSFLVIWIIAIIILITITQYNTIILITITSSNDICSTMVMEIIQWQKCLCHCLNEIIIWTFEIHSFDNNLLFFDMHMVLQSTLYIKITQPLFCLHSGLATAVLYIYSFWQH